MRKIEVKIIRLRDSSSYRIVFPLTTDLYILVDVHVYVVMPQQSNVFPHLSNGYFYT
jgi:hypothetical protein